MGCVQACPRYRYEAFGELTLAMDFTRNHPHPLHKIAEVFGKVDQVLEIVGDDLVLREGSCLDLVNCTLEVYTIHIHLPTRACTLLPTYHLDDWLRLDHRRPRQPRADPCAAALLGHGRARLAGGGLDVCTYVCTRCCGNGNIRTCMLCLPWGPSHQHDVLYICVCVCKCINIYIKHITDSHHYHHCWAQSITAHRPPMYM